MGKVCARLIASSNQTGSGHRGRYSEGGSLQVISQYARKVYSLDISAEPQAKLSSSFSNVEFLVGNSRELLPRLLDDISSQGQQLGFVLVDGDHSPSGVMADANAILKYEPVRRLLIVFHDSFNPECRSGILSADWQACDYVHYFEADFVPGIYYEHALGRAAARSMWGGLPWR